MRPQDYKTVVNTERTSGGFMTLTEGENKVRIVSEFEHFEGSYNGKPKQKFICYVIDRKDGEVKPLIVGPQIFGKLGELSVSTEYGFDTPYPPYDTIITKHGKGIETEYSLTAARNNTDLTVEERTKISELKPLSTIVDKLLKKEEAKAKEEPEFDPEYDDIPVIGQDEEVPF